MLNADVEVDRRDFAVRVAFAVAPGERLALFGPSGAGKTTILEAIAGLVLPRQGTVELGGRVLTRTSAPRRAVPPWRRRVGLLRQDPALFPHLSVRQNLTYAPGAATRGEEIGQIASRLGISGLLGDRPARLSGGQAHRVALGRLLLAHCDALLLDEPYTGLDAALRRDLTDLVRDLVAARQVPAVLVAHELDAAQAFADRLAVLDRGQILQEGSPSEVVTGPASRRVAELVGYRSFAAGAETGRVWHGGRRAPGSSDHGAPTRAWAGGNRPGPVLPPGRGRLGGGHRRGRGHPDRAAAGQAAGGYGDGADSGPGEVVLTLLDPPYFGPDGARLTAQVAG